MLLVVFSAGVLSKNHIAVSFLLCWCLFWSGAHRVKPVLLCFKGTVVCTGQQHIVLHLISRTEKDVWHWCLHLCSGGIV